jgi:hypothetical protein
MIRIIKNFKHTHKHMRPYAFIHTFENVKNPLQQLYFHIILKFILKTKTK